MLKNPFAITSSGKIVHIDDASREAGPFTCAGCNSPIKYVKESRQYRRLKNERESRNRAHFSHGKGEVCDAGLETSLHLWAKMIIEESMQICFPLQLVRYRDLERNFETNWRIFHVEVEPWQHGIRPDIALHHDDGILNIEIFVHHQVDERKFEILRERGRSCIEIDLRNLSFDSTPSDDLRHAILSGAPRKWITHQLDAERVEILKSQWHSKINEAGLRLRDAIANPTLSSDIDTDALEREIAEHSTEPFIGRATPYSHWFAVPAYRWQHTVLRLYLARWNKTPSGDFDFWTPPSTWRAIEPLLNKRLDFNPSDELLTAAGISRSEYGSPRRAIASYFASLCSEPDNPRTLRAMARIVSWGNQPGRMIIHPEREEYLERVEHIKRHFYQAQPQRSFRTLDFQRWFSTILPLYRKPPQQLCVPRAEPYLRLLVDFHAIHNMNNGGRPADHLMGILNERDRALSEASYYRSYEEGGGPHPKLKGVFKACPSSNMMRQKVPNILILERMAFRNFGCQEKAEAFLSTPNPDLFGFTPRQVCSDLAHVQFCIDLMPVGPERRNGSQKIFRRIW